MLINAIWIKATYLMSVEGRRFSSLYDTISIASPTCISAGVYLST